MRTRFHLLILIIAVSASHAQDLKVLPAPVRMDFPDGYDVVGPNGNLVKALPQERAANVEGYIDHQGMRYYISDWSLKRLRENRIAPNLIRPRGRIVKEAPADGYDRLLSVLEPDAAKALKAAHQEAFSDPSNVQEHSRFSEIVHAVSEAVRSGDEQLARMGSQGVPQSRLADLRAYLHYGAVTDAAPVDWDAHLRLFNQLSLSRSKTTIPELSNSFPSPMIGRDENFPDLSVDWLHGWRRQSDPSLEAARKSPHATVQTRFSDKAKIASEVVGRRFVARSFAGDTSVYVFDAVTGAELGRVNPEALGYSLRDNGLTPINLNFDGSESFLVFRRNTDGFDGGVTYLLNLNTWELGSAPFAYPVLSKSGGRLELFNSEDRGQPGFPKTVANRGSVCSLGDGCDPGSPLRLEAVNRLLARFAKERKLYSEPTDQADAERGGIPPHFIEPAGDHRYDLKWPDVFGDSVMRLDLRQFSLIASETPVSPSTALLGAAKVPAAASRAPCFLGHLFSRQHVCADAKCRKEIEVNQAYRSRDGRWILPVFEYDRGLMPSGWELISTIGAWDSENNLWSALPAFPRSSPPAPFATSSPRRIPVALPGRIDKTNAPYRHHYFEAGQARLWVSSYDNVLHCVDLDRSEVLRCIEGIPAFQFFAVSGEWLLGVPDARVPLMELWSHESAKKILTIFPDRQGSFIAVSPEGYFATRGASRGQVVFRLGDRGFPLDQFDAKLNRPDLILAEMGAGNEERTRFLSVLAKRRLERIAEADSVEVPVVEFESAPKADEGNLECAIRAGSGGVAPEFIRAEINGVPVWSGRMEAPVTRFSVPLSEGENRLRVFGETGNGISSIPLEGRFSQARSATAKRFIVSIGVSRYQGPDMNLDFARKDAGDIAAAFSDPSRETEVLLLEDERFSVDSLDEIAAFLSKAAIHDEVILFLAGHGMLNENYEYFYAPSDMDFDSPESRGVPFARLEQILSEVHARKRLMLIDTCHAGYIDPEENERLLALASKGGTDGGHRSAMKFRSFQPAADGPGTRGGEKGGGLSGGELAKLREFFPDFSHRDGITVFAASGGAEFAWEKGETRNGLFTYAILTSLSDRKADRDGDGMISVPELLEAAAPKVTELSEGLQHPSSRGVNLLGGFVLGKVRD